MNNFVQATRYDQFINCEANEFSNKTLVLETKKGYIKTNDFKCCIEYDINWYDKTYKEIFCSKIEDKNKCLIEINFFKHFVFRRCIENGIESLVHEIKNKFSSFDNGLSHLNKISIYSLIVNLKKLEKLNLLDKFKQQIFKRDEEFKLITNNINLLFVKCLYLVSEIDIDKILKNEIINPYEPYLTNNYINKKIEELSEVKAFSDITNNNKIEENENKLIIENRNYNNKDKLEINNKKVIIDILNQLNKEFDVDVKENKLQLNNKINEKNLKKDVINEKIYKKGIGNIIKKMNLLDLFE